MPNLPPLKPANRWKPGLTTAPDDRAKWELEEKRNQLAQGKFETDKKR